MMTINKKCFQQILQVSYFIIYNVILMALLYSIVLMQLMSLDYVIDNSNNFYLCIKNIKEYIC